MVANGGLTIIYVISLDYFVYIVFLAGNILLDLLCRVTEMFHSLKSLGISWTVMLKIDAKSKHFQISFILSNDSHNNFY